MDFYLGGVVSFLYALAYVGVLYLRKNSLSTSRNDPEVVRFRILVVSILCILLYITTTVILAATDATNTYDASTMMGIITSPVETVVKSVAYSLGLIGLLFLGPLCQEGMDWWNGRPAFWELRHTSRLISFRNLIMASNSHLSVCVSQVEC
jgi:hypothetical protein